MDESEVNVSKIVPSGICGNIDNISETATPSKFRDRVGCTETATHQVWAPVEDPDDARVVSACEAHVDDAKAFVASRQVNE